MKFEEPVLNKETRYHYILHLKARLLFMSLLWVPQILLGQAGVLNELDEWEFNAAIESDGFLYLVHNNPARVRLQKMDMAGKVSVDCYIETFTGDYIMVEPAILSKLTEDRFLVGYEVNFKRADDMSVIGVGFTMVDGLGNPIFHDSIVGGHSRYIQSIAPDEKGGAWILLKVNDGGDPIALEIWHVEASGRKSRLDFVKQNLAWQDNLLDIDPDGNVRLVVLANYFSADGPILVLTWDSGYVVPPTIDSFPSMPICEHQTASLDRKHHLLLLRQISERTSEVGKPSVRLENWSLDGCLNWVLPLPILEYSNWRPPIKLRNGNWWMDADSFSCLFDSKGRLLEKIHYSFEEESSVVDVFPLVGGGYALLFETQNDWSEPHHYWLLIADAKGCETSRMRLAL